MMKSFSPAYIRALQSSLLKAPPGGKDTGPPPESFSRSTHQHLMILKKREWLNPTTPIGRGQLIAEIYYGSEYGPPTSEFLVLPRNDRVLDLIAPGSVVFLSDEVVHHYAIIYNYRRRDQRARLSGLGTHCTWPRD